MDEYENLNHTVWDRIFHLVFIPKCRRNTLYLELLRSAALNWRSAIGNGRSEAAWISQQQGNGRHR